MLFPSRSRKAHLLLTVVALEAAACSGSSSHEETHELDGSVDTGDASTTQGDGDSGGDGTDPDPMTDAEAPDADTPDAGPDPLDGSVDDAGADAASDASATDASSGDASSGDASSDDASGSDAGLAQQLYVDPAAGSNDNLGTLASPLKTIAYAASLAVAGDTIWLLDGTYDSSTEPRFGGSDAAPCGALSGITLPSDVTVRALNAGNAILSVSGPHGFCMTGGALLGLDMRHPNAGGRIVEPSGGSVLIESTRFTNAGTGGGGGEGALYASGDADVIVRPGNLSNLVGSPAYTFAVASDQSRITIEGGTISGTLNTGISGNAVLVAINSAELVLDDVTVEETTQPYAIAVTNDAKVTLRSGSLLQGNSTARNGIHQLGNASLTIEDSTIQGFGTGILANIYESVNPTISATNAVIQDNVHGVYFGGDTSPLLANCTFVGGQIVNNSDNGFYSNIPGSYQFDGAVISGNGFRGLNFWNGANDYDIKVRGSTVTDNGSSGVYLMGSASSSLDLGRLADPGENTFTGNNSGNVPNEANVKLNVSGLLAQAVGNTWEPNIQGADDDGRYNASGAGAVLDYTSASGNGANYVIVNGTLRVAQNP